MQPTSEVLFEYLRSAIYDPEHIILDLVKLPEEFQTFGGGLQYYVECVLESRALAQALSKGDLAYPMPSPENEIAAPLKSLYASLKHLTWQAQQIAKGDYTQRVDFMGEFSIAFNTMVEQLAERQKMQECKLKEVEMKSYTLEKSNHELEDYAYHDSVTKLFNRTFGMLTLERWLREKKRFALVFVDLDGLKYINDKYGHHEGDLYIINAAKHLRAFSPEAVICRIGGDEFMLLAQNTGYDVAHVEMGSIYRNLQNDEYLKDKSYEYSISFGMVTVDPDNSKSASDLLSIADERMYEDKRAKKKARKR